MAYCSIDRLIDWLEAPWSVKLTRRELHKFCTQFWSFFLFSIFPSLIVVLSVNLFHWSNLWYSVLLLDRAVDWLLLVNCMWSIDWLGSRWLQKRFVFLLFSNYFLVYFQHQKPPRHRKRRIHRPRRRHRHRRRKWRAPRNPLLQLRSKPNLPLLPPRILQRGIREHRLTLKKKKSPIDSVSGMF